jgi:hypothetical protein
MRILRPAPAMKAYVEARVEGEEIVRQSRLSATFVRP